MSLFEDHIAHILHSSSLKYQTEYQFSDCYNGLYRFDFYIPSKKICIECNGIQHYTYTSYFYKNKSEFLKAQERDRRKIAYCLARGIKLYIIPYWDKDLILTSADIFQEKYRARSKFHNDQVARTHFSK